MAIALSPQAFLAGFQAKHPFAAAQYPLLTKYAVPEEPGASS